MNHESDVERNFIRLNGLTDYIKINPTDSIRELTSQSFTFAVMVRKEIGSIYQNT